jgi:hypothetical protein
MTKYAIIEKSIYNKATTTTTTTTTTTKQNVDPHEHCMLSRVKKWEVERQCKIVYQDLKSFYIIGQ